MADELRVGNVRIRRVEEWQGDFLPPSAFFVGFDPGSFERVAGPRPTEGGAFVDTCVFEDSVQPLIDAGQVELIGDGYRLSESVSFQLVPGHTPGHVAMQVRSRGEEAIFVGDVLHHPLQVQFPDWNSPFCEDQPRARATRRRILAEAADRDALLVPAHFGGAHCCRVRRDGDSFVPEFDA